MDPGQRHPFVDRSPGHPSWDPHGPETDEAAVVLAVGGTGGHFFPALALVEELREQAPQLALCLAGPQAPWEQGYARAYGLPYRRVPCGSFSHTWSRRIWSMAQMLQGTAAATAWLRTLGRRGVLVAFGAFPSVPLVLAARAAQWRVLLVELNAVPGRATRILHPFCDLVCLAYPSARRWLPGARVALLPGVPVRRAVRQAASDRQARASQPTEGKPLVLGVLGGSQGAVRLNRVVVETLSWLRPTLSRFWVVHQTGFRDWNVVRALYEENHFPGAVVPFLEDVSLVYRLADVVICRGGASTLAEIAACGIPAAVLPYPYAVANHQWHNARHLQQEFPLELVAHHDDDQKTAAALCCAIHRLLRCSPEARSSAQGKARVNSLGEAAQRLAQRVLELYES